MPSDFVSCGELTASSYFEMIDFDPEAVGAEANFIEAVCCFMEAKTQGCEEIALGEWIVDLLDLYSEYFDGKTVDLETIFDWLDCAIGLDEIELTEDQTQDTNAPIGDGNAPECGNPLRTDDPVHVAFGHKHESEVDVSVPLIGGAFSIRRDYTSHYDYTGANLVGRNWTASPFTFIWEVEENQQTTPWCGGPPPVWSQVEYAEGNGRYYPAGATNLFMEAATLTIDSVQYPVWRQVNPGQWEVDYLRSGTNVEAHEVGLMRQRRDVYGNSWSYNYTDFGSTPPVARLTSIVCRNASNPTNPDAELRFIWNTSSQFALDGTLAAIQVVRFDGGGVPHQTHLIEYLYEADGDPNQSISGELGTPGDLIQVVVRERTDSIDGSGAPIDRVLITQYRYHDSLVTSRSNGDGRLTVIGEDHQLKMIIRPEQIEAFAEEYGYSDIEAAAAALLTMDDGDELGTSGSPKVVDLATKIVAYEVSGNKVSRQYIQAGCGCSGGSGETQRFDYAYIDSPTSIDTTEVREYVAGSTSVYSYHYYDWQVVGGSVAPTPYLAQYALIEPGATGEPDGRMWVTGYEYNSLRELTFVAMPSALASYTPGSATAAASYTKSTTAGLVHCYEYEDHRVTSMGVRKGYDSNIANYTKVWEQDFDVNRPWLVTELRRFSTESASPTDDEIEVTAFEYAFHSGDALKWTKMTVEAELASENGPTGTNGVYETAELFDTLGNNTWSLAADGALTKRVFDLNGVYQAAGRPLKVIRNSDTTGLPIGAGAKPALANNDWNGRNSDGLALTTEYAYDIAGDIVSITLPGDVSTWTRREMRPFAGRTTVENYYASIVLPAKSGTEVNGPITITWYNADNDVIGRSDYAVADVGNYDPTNGVYSLGTQLARSEVSHSLSGLLEETREWWDAGHSPDTTTYAYDDLGRLEFITDPNGTITEHHEYDVLNRVLEVRTGTDEQAMATVAQFFYDWDHSGDPEQGQGDGNLILSRLFTGEINGSDPVVRDTEAYFDFRNRPTKTVNPLPPHEIVVYDNLDRVAERGVFKIEPTAIDQDLLQRGLYTKRSYSQRGLAYRDSIAADPTAALPEFLESNRWFDPVGRPVVAWEPNAPIIKTDYDSLGRVKTRYLARDEDLFTYGPGRNGSPPIDNEGEVAYSVADDQVIEQTEYTYDASYEPKGTLDVVSNRHRLHDATELTTGALTGSNSVPLSTGFYYDAFRRRIRTANFGVGDLNEDEFKKGASNPSWPPSQPPDYDDYYWNQFIIEATSYDSRGLVDIQMDSEGKETKFAYDMLSRRIAVVENYDDSTGLGVSWSGSLDRWVVTNISTANDANRATTFVFDGVGNIRKQVAHLPETSDPNDSEVQETEYLYGVTITGGSLIDSNSLLGEVRYPDETTGLAGTAREYKVLYQYNRLGELLGVEDQNETLHAYARDALGRVTLDAATITPGSGIDDWVLSLGVAFDDFGRLASVTSYTDLSGSTAKNQASFTYSPLWQIKDVYQDHDGVVTIDGSGVPTGNTLRVQYAYSTADVEAGNHSRLNRITYPDGAEYDHYYGASMDLDDHISRLTRLKIAGLMSDAVAYQHVGLGMIASVDYPTPDIALDRTVSHDGKRRTQGYQTQWEGVYPGWDRFGRVKKHAWVDGAYTTGSGNPNVPPLAEIDYSYDRASNRLTRTDAQPGASWADRDFKYAYDGLDRLVQADRGAQGGSWSHAVGGQQWALDMLGNWDSIANDANGDGDYLDSGEEVAREHNFANEIEEIGGVLPFAYDKAGNMTDQDLPSLSTKSYTHDAWNRLVSIEVDEAVLGEYEYNALHWRSVKRSRSLGAGSLDEMRLMYYSANWQLLEERIDRQWPGSGFTEDERAQTFWGKRYIDDAVARRRDRAVSAGYEDNFFYVTDAQFSTVAMVKASNARVVERVTYDSYGKARHHFGGDVTGDGAATAAGDDAALVATINAGSNSIGQVNYKAEQDLNRDGQITNADRTTLAALTGGADQAALVSGMVSFTTTGSGGSIVYGPDNSIAWDGYVFNPETSQYLVRFRWYDPVLGRWLERDPAGYVDGLSLYAYVNGRPQFLLDPLGLAPPEQPWHWHHMIPQACRDRLGDMIDDPEFGWLLLDEDHSTVHPEWNRDFKAWLARFEETNGRLPDRDELLTQCRGMRKSTKYKTAMKRGFATDMPFTMWRGGSKAVRQLKDKLLRIASKRLPRRFVKGAAKSVPVVSFIFSLWDREARAEDYGEGASWCMTVLDNVPIIDIGLAASEIIEQYNEEKRLAELEFQRAFDNLVNEAKCDDPCPDDDTDDGIDVEEDG